MPALVKIFEIYFIVLYEREIFYNYKSLLVLVLRLHEASYGQFNKEGVMRQLPEVGVWSPGEM